MASYDSRSCAVLAFFFFIFAVGGYLTAFGSPNWVNTPDANYGLWQHCVQEKCVQMSSGDLTAAFTAGRAMACITLVCIAVSLGGHLGWLVTLNHRACIVAWAAGMSAGFTAALGLMAVGTDSERYHGDNYLDWSFWVALGSDLLLLLTAGVTACATGCGADGSTASTIMYSTSGAAPRGNFESPGHMEYSYDGPAGDSSTDYAEIGALRSYGDVSFNDANIYINSKQAAMARGTTHSGYEARADQSRGKADGAFGGTNYRY